MMIQPAMRSRLASSLLAVVALALAPGCGDANGPDSRGAASPPAAGAGTPSLSDGKGTADVDPGDPVPIDSRGTWTIRYHPGPLGITPGGGLVLQVSPFWGWSPPQAFQARAPGYVTATCTDPGVRLELDGDPSLHWIRALVQGAPLHEGATVTLVYGDTAGGAHPEAAARADSFAEDDEEFLLKVDGDGDGFYAPIEYAPTLDILAGPMERLVLFAPSLVRPGEEIELHLAALDFRRNRATGYEGTVVLRDLEPGIDHPDRVVLRPADRGAVTVHARAAREGVARIVAHPEGDPERIAVSNPVVITTRDLPYRLLWGDLQIHSGLSDGSGTPEQIYTYARDVAGLDVAALTDHDAHGIFALDETPAAWQRILAAARRFHDPGRFVTFPAFEWTSWTYGHKHVLFLDDAPPLLSNRHPETSTPEGLWAHLPQGRAMTISHHTLGLPIPEDWSHFDPRYEFVVEICSIHGNSEGVGAPLAVRGAKAGHGVRDALARGYRLGLVASGDTHNGHPGLGDSSAPLGGVAGIYARERTRQGIWEALRARRVFASSGPRVVLDVSLNGKPMGSTVPLGTPTDTRSLHVEAYAPIRIEAAEIFKNGSLMAREPLDRLRLGIDLEDPEEARDGDFYYVRLRMMHDQMAWSSPIWIDLAGGGR